MDSPNRNTSIELLRIVLMAMIVCWHFVVHGLHYSSLKLSDIGDSDLANIILLSVLCCHVNCFIFISGYFGIKTTRKRLVAFTIPLVIYSFFPHIINVFYFHNYMGLRIMGGVIPVSYNVWWFATLYYFLMLFAPIINAGILAISRKKFECILCLTFFSLASGFAFLSMSWNQTILFLFMYLLGRYFRLYDFKLRFNPFYGFILSIIGVLCFTALFCKSSFYSMESAIMPFDYSNPFCITMAVSLFFMFKRINLPQIKTINKIATGSFAVYLISDGVFRSAFNKNIINLVGSSLPMLIFAAIIITIVLCCVDIFRQKLTKPIEEYIASKF